MSLREFIALEEANASDIEQWTDLRNELTQAYDNVAVEIAAEHGAGEDILAAARHAPTAPTDHHNPGTPAHRGPAAFRHGQDQDLR